MSDDTKSSVLSKLFDLFKLKLHCDCLGPRDEDDPTTSKIMGNGMQERSTEATWIPRQDIGPEKDLVDKNYMESLLQGLKDTYIEGPVDTDAIQIKKKKHVKSASPRWNVQLSQMLSQAVNLYGSNVDLIHAFFPGFKKEFIVRKVKKCLKALDRKMGWKPSEDEKLFRLIQSDNIEISTVLREFPDRNLAAVVERAALLKSQQAEGQINGQQIRGGDGNGVISREEEYDFSRMLTRTNSDEYSTSDNLGLTSEADDADFGFNPTEAGFSFTFEHDIQYGAMNTEQTSPKNEQTCASMMEDTSLAPIRLSGLEFDRRDKPSLNIYGNQIDYLFPESNHSFGDLVEERALRADVSATNSLLDLTVQRRQSLELEENSPTAVIRIHQVKQQCSNSFADEYLNI